MDIKLVKFTKNLISKSYLGWLNNPKLNKYSRLREKKNTKKDALNYLNQMRSNLFYAIILKKNNKHVGNIAAYLDDINKIADISILLAYQKKGYGFRAWKLMEEKLLKMKYRKITAGTMSNNLSMINLFKKRNMKFEYKKIKHFKYKGKLIDLIGYYKFL